MKKLILSCLSALLLSGAAKAQLSYGPELGMNLSNYRIQFPGFFPPSTIPIPGAHVGGVLNYRFNDHVAIEPGAYFAINGIKYTYDLLFFGSITAVTHLNTIKVPVNFIYTFNGGKLFIGAGPFVGMNLGGKAKLSATIPGLDSLLGTGFSLDTTGKITAGNDSTDFIKKFDFGVGVQVGYNITNNLFIRATYSRGLLNMSPTAALETSAIHSINYALSVGYLFGDRPKTKTKAGMKGKK